MDIERKFLPIYRNATALVRPRTGLQDMFVELDPGSKSAGEFEDGDTIPIANTAAAGQPRRGPRGARRRHAGLPAGAVRRRRPGSEGTRPGPRQGPRRPRADQPRSSPSSTALVAQRRGQPRQPDPQPQRADRSGRRQRRHAGAARRLLQLRPRRDRRARTSTCSAPSRCCRARSATARTTLGKVEPLRGESRPDVQRPAAVRPQPRRAERLGAPRRRHRAGDPRRDPALRALGARADLRPAPGRPAAWPARRRA